MSGMLWIRFESALDPLLPAVSQSVPMLVPVSAFSVASAVERTKLIRFS